MREKILAGNIYHVLNRGVDKRNIFLDDEDRVRFIHDLFEFNDTATVNNSVYYFQAQYKGVQHPYIPRDNRVPRTLLVELLAFALMPNHYHLMIKPRSDAGLQLFMKKLNGGYTNYFNEKYERGGALFQGRYKAVSVKDESHFIHLPYYIHCNPLDLVAPEWRERELKNHKEAMTFLENYRWSSFPDYIGKKNFPSVTQREFLVKFLGDSNRHKKDMIRWFKNLDIAGMGRSTLLE